MNSNQHCAKLVKHDRLKKISMNLFVTFIFPYNQKQNINCYDLNDEIFVLWSYYSCAFYELGRNFPPSIMLTCEEKVVFFLKIWWRFNEAFLNYLEVITIGMKPTLMKERRFDDIHVDQGWNMCFPHNYIITKVYLKFVIHFVDLVALIDVFGLCCVF